MSLSSHPCKMYARNTRNTMFQNGLSDTEENEDNFNSPKRRRRNICSTSNSESESIENDAEKKCNLTWTTKNFMPQIHPFSTKDSGIKTKLPRSSSILDYFQLFISEELAQYIVDETNDYRAHKNLDAPTTIDELYCFFALSLLMTRNKKLKIQEYWSKDKYLRSSIFPEIMIRDRYLSLLSTIHFTHESGSSDDRLVKIRDVVNMFRKSFNQTLHPFQDLCIDESLMLYKGRLSFKQYIPSKRNRFGIKSYMLCDCKTGYVQDIIVYCGRSTFVENTGTAIGKSGAIVLSLLRPFLQKGHTVYLDNFYSSPELFRLLHNNSTNACGTVRKSRQGMPKFQERLKKGEACFRSSDSLLAMKWLDKREVYMITTMHTADFATVPRYRGAQNVDEPVCVIDYNKSMGIVDKVDMVTSTVNTTRKSMKWYRKFFFHMIDICVWNSYCLYKYNRREEISIAKFHLQLIKQMVAKYRRNDVIRHEGRPVDNPMRLIDRHFPSFYKAKNKNLKRRCVVCSKNDKRSDSRYECKECDVGLCVDPCFRIYHTSLYY